MSMGCSDLIVAVDHKPTTSRNIKEKSLRYRLRVIHIPSVRNTVTDALTRYPVGKAETPGLPDDVAATNPSHRFAMPIRLHAHPTKSSQPCITLSGGLDYIASSRQTRTIMAKSFFDLTIIASYKTSFDTRSEHVEKAENSTLQTGDYR